MKTSTHIEEHKSTDFATQIKYGNVSLGIRLMRFYLKVIGQISPKYTAKKVSQLFRTPRRGLGTKQEAWYSSQSTTMIDINSARINLVGQLDSPTTLLVHGWDSSSYAFRHMLEYMSLHSIPAVAVDLPAHGYSSGNITNLKEVETVIAFLLEQFPSITNLVGYSFGGASSMTAVTNSQVNKFVTIGSPLRYQDITDPFFELLKVPSHVRPLFFEVLESIVHRSREEWFNLDALERSEIDWLILHDEQDEIVPVTIAETVSESLHNVSGHFTRGNGHRGMLSSPEVLELVTEFLGHE